MTDKSEKLYEYLYHKSDMKGQFCPVCKSLIGIMPGSRDAVCHTCGFKDPCCE